MVAIVGLPNAGKSSLLNVLLGTKLSIVTPAAQTTRERVVGIDTRDGVQMVFLDTPGLVDPAYLLHHAMLGIVDQAIKDADVVVLIVDATRPPPDLTEEIEAALRNPRNRLVVALNKSDVAQAGEIESMREWAAERFGVTPLVLSAMTGEGMEMLRAAIADGLPESPFLYPEDELSIQTLRFFVSELIRETVFEQYGEEIPYSTAVRIEEYREEDDPLFIRASVFVERPSQKGIIIGQGGQAIRNLGTASRAKIEAFLERRIYLDLWVKVLPKWRKNPVDLKRFGFPLPRDKKRS